MSRFYGVIKGTKGEATRCGAKTSGMHVVAASWNGCVDVRLNYNPALDIDMASVVIRPWKERGVYLRLYEGPIHPPPPSEVEQALRCRTCVHYSEWTPICKSNGESS